jgi:hypothetical protein
LFALSAAQVMVVIASGPGLAGGPISNESDVLGIKLSMNRDQVKKLISDTYPGSPIVELPVELGTPEFKKSTIAGFAVDVTSRDDQAVSRRANEQANKDFEAKKAAGFGDSPLNRTFASHRHICDLPLQGIHESEFSCRKGFARFLDRKVRPALACEIWNILHMDGAGGSRTHAEARYRSLLCRVGCRQLSL